MERQGGRARNTVAKEREEGKVGVIVSESEVNTIYIGEID